MTDLIVFRDYGDHPGPDIVDPLMTDNRIALVRGRVELDENEPADEVRLTLPFQSITLGQTVFSRDAAYGVWAGKVTSVAHRIRANEDGSLSSETEISIRRPHAGNPSCIHSIN